MLASFNSHPHLPQQIPQVVPWRSTQQILPRHAKGTAFVDSTEYFHQSTIQIPTPIIRNALDDVGFSGVQLRKRGNYVLWELKDEEGKTLLGLVKRQMVILDEKMVGDLSSYLLQEWQVDFLEEFVVMLNDMADFMWIFGPRYKANIAQIANGGYFMEQLLHSAAFPFGEEQESRCCCHLSVALYLPVEMISSWLYKQDGLVTSSRKTQILPAAQIPPKDIPLHYRILYLPAVDFYVVGVHGKYILGGQLEEGRSKEVRSPRVISCSIAKQILVKLCGTLYLNEQIYCVVVEDLLILGLWEGC